MLRYTIPLLVCLTTWWCGSCANAQQQPSALQLERSTFVVLRIDLQEFDLAPLLTFAGSLPEGWLANAPWVPEADKLGAMLSSFREAGAGSLSVVLTTEDVMQRLPYLIVELQDEAAGEEVVQQLSALGLPGGDACRRLDNVVFWGSQRQLDRYVKNRAAPSEEMTAALEASRGGVIQLAIRPAEEQRRVLEDMAPSFPAETGRVGRMPLADSLVWIAGRVSTEPRIKIELVVQSRDERSAESLKSVLMSAPLVVARAVKEEELLPTITQAVQLFEPKVTGDRLWISWEQSSTLRQRVESVVRPPVDAILGARHRAQCMNSLKHLALAVHVFYDKNRGLPPSASYDEEGNKLLSWRVFLLPYLEEQELFNQFHLDEPWDSEHNRQLIAKMPNVFACPGAGLKSQGRTTYLAPVAAETVFSGRKGHSFRDIKDGTSNTLLIVETDAEHAVVWTKPDDLNIDFEHPKRGLGGAHKGGFNGALCDGSVRFLESEIDAGKLKRLLMRADGQPIE